MGKIISKVTDAVGLTNTKAEERAAQQAGINSANAYALNKEHVALMKEQLEFQKEQYADWDEIYGSMQDNLGEYYNNLDEDDMTVKGLESVQREYQSAIKLIEQDASVKGISGSGIEYGTKTALTMSNAVTRAGIRANAEDAVAEKKMQFLGLGLGQGTAMLGAINQAGANAGSAFQSGVSASTAMNANYLQQQTQFGLANMDAMGDVVGMMAGGYGG